jgi:hypothetical protein
MAAGSAGADQERDQAGIVYVDDLAGIGVLPIKDHGGGY